MINFRLLGQVAYGCDGHTTAIGPPKLRSFAAALLLYPNQEVSYDRLTALLWHDPPKSALYNLRTYAFKLRQSLDTVALGDRLSTRRGGAGGYRLTVHHGELDRQVFADLAENGRVALAQGHLVRAAESLRRALLLWSGPAGDDVPSSAAWRSHFDAINDERLAAVEDHAEARLGLHEVTVLVPELAGLTALHPLRERLWELRIRAQYLHGDASAALATYRNARAVFSTELGIDPSMRLQQLQLAVLRRDDEAVRTPRPFADLPARHFG